MQPPSTREATIPTWRGAPGRGNLSEDVSGQQAGHYRTSGGMQPSLKEGAHAGEAKGILAMPQCSRYDPLKWMAAILIERAYVPTCDRSIARDVPTAAARSLPTASAYLTLL